MLIIVSDARRVNILYFINKSKLAFFYRRNYYTVMSFLPNRILSPIPIGTFVLSILRVLFWLQKKLGRFSLFRRGVWKTLLGIFIPWALFEILHIFKLFLNKDLIWAPISCPYHLVLCLLATLRFALNSGKISSVAVNKLWLFDDLQALVYLIVFLSSFLQLRSFQSDLLQEFSFLTVYFLRIFISWSVDVAVFWNNTLF